MTDLSAASLEDVRGFFRTYYAPNNATLVIAGDFRPDSAKRWVARYFGEIPRGPPSVSAARAIVHGPRDTFLVLEDHVQLPKFLRVALGEGLPSRRCGAGSVGVHAWLGTNPPVCTGGLVYDRQIAQDVDANQEGQSSRWTLRIAVTPKPDVPPATIDTLVRAAIRRVIDSGVTELELQRAKNVHHARTLDACERVIAGRSTQLLQLVRGYVRLYRAGRRPVRSPRRSPMCSAPPDVPRCPRSWC